MKMIDLQNQFVTQAAQPAPPGWEQLKIHYESYNSGGESFEKYVSNAVVGGERADLDLSLDALELLVELQKHRPEGQTEVWTWVEIEIDSTGKYAFDYQYGIPPLTARALRYPAR